MASSCSQNFQTLSLCISRVDVQFVADVLTLAIHVGCSSKIQTLCHMTQVLLKLRFKRKNSQVIKVGFLHLQMCRLGILLTSIYITQQVLATPTLIGM